MIVQRFRGPSIPLAGALRIEQGHADFVGDLVKFFVRDGFEGFPRRLSCSLTLTAFSCIAPWVSSLPPTSLKFSPVVMRVWPSLLSRPRPNSQAIFLVFT